MRYQCIDHQKNHRKFYQQSLRFDVRVNGVDIDIVVDDLGAIERAQLNRSGLTAQQFSNELVPVLIQVVDGQQVSRLMREARINFPEDLWQDIREAIAEGHISVGYDQSWGRIGTAGQCSRKTVSGPTPWLQLSKSLSAIYEQFAKKSAKGYQLVGSPTAGVEAAEQEARLKRDTRQLKQATKEVAQALSALPTDDTAFMI